MFDTQDDYQGTPSAQPAADRALTEPNPEPGMRLRLVWAVDDAPVGSEVILIGSLFRYEDAQPADEFEVEYRGTLLTVQRCEVQATR